MVVIGIVRDVPVNAMLVTKELRCQSCGKLLAEKAAVGTVIVCSRCKTRNEAD